MTSPTQAISKKVDSTSFHWRKLLDPEFYPEITIRRSVFFFIWTIPHIIICAYMNANPGKKANSRVSIMNRVSMACSLFDLAAILIFMSPTFLSLCRRTFLPRFITFEKNIHAHKVASYTMLFWSILHTGYYYHQYVLQTKPGIASDGTPMLTPMFIKKTGWTGHVLLFALFLIMVTSIIILFYYVHHLFILYIVMMFMHHKAYMTTDYIAGPLALYVVDRVYRPSAAHLPNHLYVPSSSIPRGWSRFRWTRRSWPPSGPVYCPSVSLFQWHPMTISSAPEEELLTIHFRLYGGWTRKLAKRVGCEFEAGNICDLATQKLVASKIGADAAGRNSSYISIDMVAKGDNAVIRDTLAAVSASTDDDDKNKPIVSIHGKADMSANAQMEGGNLPMIFIDGPYSSPTEHFFDYEVSVLIAAGVGVTPAAADLTMKKVYLFWVYRDITTLEWFKDLLIALEEKGMSSIVEVRTYYTGNLPTGCTPEPSPAGDRFGDQVINSAIGTKSYIGRPDFDDIFDNVGANHPNTRIGTFFCGPKPMARKTRREAHNSTKLDFHAEVF
ncbi:hypothetical protein BX661DRAFT_183458 [Kickxella alabastrina]|uniref:uncharacterized protein n=1 Tax=Kickxella alabastrina TaxID=61397 RepID=UPI00221EFC29|nr:uncharacterized protein BX661DRAFT_183458 [Kickxella alabastrina]KAI7826779.1 hypothetical protein BX661DRAFT_183458 [Kickxella alabastrina]